MRRLALPILCLLVLVGVIAGWSLTPAQGEAGKTLGTHPMADAKPGEYVRFSVEKDGWKRYYVERVLKVEGGKVAWEIWKTNEDGTKLESMQYEGFDKVPKPWKALKHQDVVKDEIVELEIDGKKIKARYFEVNQPENPPFPEPKIRREVWYSNDIGARGKVQELPLGRETITWGMMSEADLKTALEMRAKRKAKNKEKGG